MALNKMVNITSNTRQPRKCPHVLKFGLIPVLLAGIFTGLMTNISVCHSKPTISMFQFPASLTASLPSLSSYTRQFVDKTRGMGSSSAPDNQMKSFSGFRVSNDSLVMIYWHDQTIAIVELGAAKLLLNCEIIEIYDDKEGQRLLHKLSDLNRPLQIQFKEMIQLMEQCQIVDRQNYARQDLVAGPERVDATDGQVAAASDKQPPPQSPLTLLSGIIPGTKWCGTGDIASTYSDLGAQTIMDRCCRSHDLCPVKVRAFQTRYGLENNSIYTKSHCVCDDILFSCLKRTNTSAAQVMGSIYFNLVQVPCFTETAQGAMFRRAREGF